MSKRYWEQRAAREAAAYQKLTQKKLVASLTTLYKVEGEELHSKLLLLLEKVEHDALTKEGVHMNDLYRTAKYNKIIEEFNTRLTAIGSKEQTILEEALIGLYKNAQKCIDKSAPSTLSQQTFQYASAIDPTQVVKQAWAIDGRDLSQRIWKSQEKTAQVLTKELYDSCAQGKSAFDMAQSITEKLNAPLKQSYTLARTESAHAVVQAQVDKYKEYGFTQAVYLGQDCCDDCAQYDGNVYTLDEIAGMIPNHPNCRCSFTLERQ